MRRNFENAVQKLHKLQCDLTNEFYDPKRGKNRSFLLAKEEPRGHDQIIIFWENQLRNAQHELAINQPGYESALLNDIVDISDNEDVHMELVSLDGSEGGVANDTEGGV